MSDRNAALITGLEATADTLADPAVEIDVETCERIQTVLRRAWEAAMLRLLSASVEERAA